MKCASLFSSSSGNCLFVRQGDTALLVDAGGSALRIRNALQACGEAPEQLSGIFLTHEHSDHVGALVTLMKKTPLPLFMHAQSAMALYESLLSRDEEAASRFASLVRTVEPGEEYECGSLVFSPFSLPHDSAACLGVVLGDEKEPKRLGVATDLGEMTVSARKALSGCPVVVLESNHDVEMLRNGPYPPYLQERILSEHGHLSNAASAAFLQALCAAGCSRALLYHLSRENNTPEAALACSRQALLEFGAKETDFFLATAKPDEVTVLVG